jgi:PAS domain S-box-containing protein
MKREQCEGPSGPFRVTDGELRRIVDSGAVGVVFWDRRGRIQESNDRFLQLMGYSRDDVHSGILTWSRLTPGVWDSCWVDLLAKDGISRAVDHECVRKDGERVFVRLHSMTLDDDPARILSIVLDATGQVQAARARDELVRSEQLARTEAEAAVRARDDVLAIVTHDLRTPLNTIAMCSALLASGLPRETMSEQVAIIGRAIAGMNSLIDDLLDLSQITSSRFNVQPEPVDARALCDDASVMLGPALAKKAQRFELQMPSEPVIVLADRRRVFLVLGSPDPTRYGAEMGTEFLMRIGEVSSAALSRLRTAA